MPTSSVSIRLCALSPLTNNCSGAYSKTCTHAVGKRNIKFRSPLLASVPRGPRQSTINNLKSSIHLFVPPSNLRFEYRLRSSTSGPFGTSGTSKTSTTSPFLSPKKRIVSCLFLKTIPPLPFPIDPTPVFRKSLDAPRLIGYRLKNRIPIQPYNLPTCQPANFTTCQLANPFPLTNFPLSANLDL